METNEFIKLETLINEVFLGFSKTPEQRDYLIKIRLVGEKEKRMFTVKEMVDQMSKNTKYGNFFRNIIFGSIVDIIKSQAIVMQKADGGDEIKKFDILNEKIFGSNFGKNFSERSVSIGVMACMLAFLKC